MTHPEEVTRLAARAKAIDAMFDLFDSNVVVEAAVGAILDEYAAGVRVQPEPQAGDIRAAAQEVVDATDALDDWEVTHSDWESASRAPFAGRLSLAVEALRAALQPITEAATPEASRDE